MKKKNKEKEKEMDPKNLNCYLLNSNKYKKLCSQLKRKSFKGNYSNIAEYYFPELEKYFSPYAVKLNKDGFTSDKNIDILILNNLEDEDLTNVCLTNKYVYSLCQSEEFWFNRLNKKYGDYYENLESMKKFKGDATWKEYYIWLSDILNSDQDLHYLASFAFSENREDVVYLFDSLKNIRIYPVTFDTPNAKIKSFIKLNEKYPATEEDIEKINQEYKGKIIEEKDLLGPTTFTSPDGTSIQCSYKNSLLEGSYKIFFPNGKIKIEAFYENGKLEGEYKEYNNKGQLNRLTRYSGGEKNGKEEYYFNGKYINYEIFENGKLVRSK